MTSLNIGPVTSDKQQLRTLFVTDCPKCGAKKDKRVEGGSFGGHTAIYCGACGHEFQETNR
jgi:transcription elongation factor Elf1